MNRYTIPLAFLLLMSLHAEIFAQSVENEIMKPIHLLFEGMENEDTAIIKRAFTKNVMMKVVSEKGVKIETVENFLKQIASKKVNTPKWIEKLYNTEIRVDGNLAHVWTEYSFYVGETFNHCGVDSFALIKLDGTWKIVYIMDTRRKEGCEEYLN